MAAAVGRSVDIRAPHSSSGTKELTEQEKVFLLWQGYAVGSCYVIIGVAIVGAIALATCLTLPAWGLGCLMLGIGVVTLALCVGICMYCAQQCRSQCGSHKPRTPLGTQQCGSHKPRTPVRITQGEFMRLSKDEIVERIKDNPLVCAVARLTIETMEDRMFKENLWGFLSQDHKQLSLTSAIFL